MKGTAPFSPADSFADPEADAAWDSEIRDRILLIDEGRVTEVAYEDVMRAQTSIWHGENPFYRRGAAEILRRNFLLRRCT